MLGPFSGGFGLSGLMNSRFLVLLMVGFLPGSSATALAQPADSLLSSIVTLPGVQERTIGPMDECAPSVPQPAAAASNPSVQSRYDGKRQIVDKDTLRSITEDILQDGERGANKFRLMGDYHNLMLKLGAPPIPPDAPSNGRIPVELGESTPLRSGGWLYVPPPWLFNHGASADTPSPPKLPALGSSKFLTGGTFGMYDLMTRVAECARQSGWHDEISIWREINYDGTRSSGSDRALKGLFDIVGEPATDIAYVSALDPKQRAYQLSPNGGSIGTVRVARDAVVFLVSPGNPIFHGRIKNVPNMDALEDILFRDITWGEIRRHLPSTRYAETQAFESTDVIRFFPPLDGSMMSNVIADLRAGRPSAQEALRKDVEQLYHSRTTLQLLNIPTLADFGFILDSVPYTERSRVLLIMSYQQYQQALRSDPVGTASQPSFVPIWVGGREMTGSAIQDGTWPFIRTMSLAFRNDKGARNGRHPGEADICRYVKFSIAKISQFAAKFDLIPSTDDAEQDYRYECASSP